jgi:phage I-like protein
LKKEVLTSINPTAAYFVQNFSNMKKLFLMMALVAALFATSTVSAQGGPGGDPAQMRQRMAERIKPQLIEKVKLSDAEAEKVLDIYMATMPQRREIRMDNSLSEDDKAKKVAALNEEAAKKYKAIPLTGEKVKALDEFFEDMRKNSPNRRSNN